MKIPVRHKWRNLFIIGIATIAGENYSLFGHGLNQKGPHEGFIQMPGAFHTELVPQGESGFDIYLLDGSIKNPVVKDSSVDVVLKTGKKETVVDCVKEKLRFVCKLSPDQALRDWSKIVVKAARTKNLTGIAIYNLPLKLR